MVEIPSVEPMAMQSFTFEDFSGGITDFYLGGALNKYQRADNLLIEKYGQTGKLFTRPGSELYDTTNPQIPAGNQRIGTLKYFSDELFYHSSRDIYYVNATPAFATLVGPSSNKLFPTGTDTTTQVSLTVWNKIMFLANSEYAAPSKIYKDSAGAFQLRTAGMPALASSPTATLDSAGALNLSYLYRFLYKYTYTVGTVTYIDRGPTKEITAIDTAGSAIGPATPCAITAIPALANGTTLNYDTASVNLVVEIYRTTDDGQNFFRVGEVTNGTTTFSDTVTDAVLVGNEPLYTEGGFPDNNPPPLCKLVHTVGPRTFYANIKEGSQVHSNKIMQSVPDDPDSVPSLFFTEVEDELGGFSSAQSYPIAMCVGGAIYRVDGWYDELGNGFLAPQIISETAGIVSSQSVVQTMGGVFWAGLDGFYYTDGYNVVRISSGIRTTYQSIITSAARKRRIVGKYDRLENRIYWTAQKESGATDCDTIFVLDLNWGISDDMPFTTLSGGASFAPTAIEFIDGNLIRADKRGYTFIHRSTLYTDPKVDTAVATSLWGTQTVTFDHISIATNFGVSNVRKWVPAMTVACVNTTNLSLQLVSINDDGRKQGDLKPIRFRGNITWGDADVYWGDPTIVWDFQGLIDERRRMPTQSLRCGYKQVQLTNAKVVILSSDLIGTCNVDSAASTATLSNTVTYDWPSGAVDYYLAFAVDDFTKEYLVTARTADALTFSDPDSIAVTATGTEWVLRGYPKGEIMQLLSYTFEYAIFGKTQKVFTASTTGEPGASE